MRKGDLLFTIDPRPYQAALDQAKAQLARDKAQLVSADAQAEALRRSREEGLRHPAAVRRRRCRRRGPGGDDQGRRGGRGERPVSTSPTAPSAPPSTAASETCSFTRATSSRPTTRRSSSRSNQITPVYVAFQRAGGAARAISGSEMPEGPLPVSAFFADKPEPRFAGTPHVRRQRRGQRHRDHLPQGHVPQRGQGPLARPVRQRRPSTLSTLKDAVVVPAQAIKQGQQGPYLYVVKPDMTAEMRTVKTGQVATARP